VDSQKEPFIHAVQVQPAATRGHGLLEPLLARLRAQRANALIPAPLREGRILDIGCGTYPYFLSHTYFREKFAIDQQSPHAVHPGVTWHTLDLNRTPTLPFDSEFFTAVTLLAVVEHLDPGSLVAIFGEVYRTLIPGGRVIVTTPAAWSGRLLFWMARLGLVSPEEIREHIYAYTLPLLGWYFGKAGFDMEKARFGYFELHANMWAAAEK